MKAIPGVELAAITSALPTTNTNPSAVGGLTIEGFAIEDRPVESSQDLRAERIRISSDYFKVLQTTLIRGRSFTEGDEDSKPLVAIIDESTARKYWPASDPLGRRVRFGRDRTKPWTSVVGVVIRVRRLNDVHIADRAAIAGKRDIQVRARQGQFTRPRFYFHQTIWLAAAMLVGWLGLVVFPGFFEACTQAVGSGWRSLGLGVGVLAGVPLAVIVVAITLVGLPLSLMLFAVYYGCALPSEDLGRSLPRTRPSEAI